MAKPSATPIEVKRLQKQIDRLEHQLQVAEQKIAALQVIHEVASSLTSELNLAPLLKKILSQAVAVMSASAGSLLLLDEQTDELEFAVIEGGGGESLKGVRMSRNKGIAGWVATHRQPLIVDDVSADQRYYQDIAEAFNFRPTSLLCVPMISHNRLIGVLQVMHATSGRYFGELDQQLLTTLANHAAIAVENARLYESLKAERDHLVEVEEEVRKRLARDLHDGPTQLLAAVVMHLSFIRELLNRSPEMVAGEIDQTFEIANSALKQLRTLLFDLRPVILETQGLIPALRVYAERLAETEELNIELNVKNDFGRLSHRAEVAIFSIVQEAITNAKKYAEASRIEVVVHADPEQDTMLVMVRDDGIGFDVEKVKTRYDEQGSLGLINMYERADMINGALKIQSEIGKGTAVILNLPLSENLIEYAEGA